MGVFEVGVSVWGWGDLGWVVVCIKVWGGGVGDVGVYDVVIMLVGCVVYVGEEGGDCGVLVGRVGNMGERGLVSMFGGVKR